MNFNTDYPIDFYYDLNFYSDYKHLFILILIVLFLQSWQGLSSTISNYPKYLIGSFILISVLAFGFTKINLTNFENFLRNNMLKIHILKKISNCQKFILQNHYR